MVSYLTDCLHSLHTYIHTAQIFLWFFLKNTPTEPGEGAPFCCSGIKEYKGRRIAADNIFAAFLRGKGHHPNVVFEVKRQVKYKI